MFCASVLRLARFTVWVFPSLIAMVRVLVSRLAVSVWLSVPLLAKSAKSHRGVAPDQCRCRLIVRQADRLTRAAGDAYGERTGTELSKAKAAMFCASVLRLARFTVWVLPSLIAMVRVLVSRLAVSVWLSVPLLTKEEKSKVTVLPSLMARVMVLLPLNADAVKV